jgi:ABC-type Fe3+ transport system permease subunit
VIIGLVYTVILFMIVPLVSTLDGMDDAMIEAGYNLGGNGFTVLRRIIVPYAMPGIVSGCIVVFMLTAGSYLTPILLGGKNSSWFTEQIYDQFITRFNWEAGAAFGFLLLLPSPPGDLARSEAERPDTRQHRCQELRRTIMLATEQDNAFLLGYRLYVLAFFIFLAAPLVAAGAFAFNDSLFPHCPGRASRSTGSSTTPSRSSGCSTTGGCCAGSTIPS